MIFKYIEKVNKTKDSLTDIWMRHHRPRIEKARCERDEHMYFYDLITFQCRSLFITFWKIFNIIYICNGIRMYFLFIFYTENASRKVLKAGCYWFIHVTWRW